MKILQISFGDQIHERMGYVHSVLSNLDEGDEYILLGDCDFIPGRTFIPIDEYEKQIRIDNPFFYKVYEQSRNVWEKSNFLRIYYCAHNSDVLYLDTDVEIFDADAPVKLDPYYSGFFSDEGPFSNKGPWRGALRVLCNRHLLPAFGHHGRTPDIYLIYNGQCTLFFKQWIDWMVRFSQTAPEFPMYWQGGYNVRYHRRQRKLPLISGFYRLDRTRHSPAFAEVENEKTQTNSTSQGADHQAR